MYIHWYSARRILKEFKTREHAQGCVILIIYHVMYSEV